MPARRKPEKHIRAAAVRASREEQTEARRSLCSWLKFRKACGHKQCLRAQACAGDADKCFERFWPLLPEEFKVCFRAGIKARLARLSPPEIAAEIKRELARWRAMMAPREAPQTAPVPAPQSPKIVPAPNARVASPPAPNPLPPGPRLRVL